MTPFAVHWLYLLPFSAASVLLLAALWFILDWLRMLSELLRRFEKEQILHKQRLDLHWKEIAELEHRLDGGDHR